MTCTRPDLSWSVGKLSQNQRRKKNTVAKHGLRYLKGTMNQELWYRKREERLTPLSNSDADWTADQNDRQSMTGYCFGLAKNLLSVC